MILSRMNQVQHSSRRRPTVAHVFSKPTAVSVSEPSGTCSSWFATCKGYVHDAAKAAGRNSVQQDLP